jgi:hypothetical protein
MRNYISTPNIRLKRKLKEEFKVYNIDEYKTSIINCKTKERNENLYLKDKKGEYRKIHSILTFKMSNKRMGCINRDMNGVQNIREIAKLWIINKERPEEFKRKRNQPLDNYQDVK